MIFVVEKSTNLEFVSQVDGTPSIFSLSSSQVPFPNKISHFEVITIDFYEKKITYLIGGTSRIIIYAGTKKNISEHQSK